MTAFLTARVAQITGTPFEPRGTALVVLSGAQLRALVACSVLVGDDSRVIEAFLEEADDPRYGAMMISITWPSDPKAGVRLEGLTARGRMVVDLVA
jgi:hypothetical protein